MSFSVRLTREADFLAVMQIFVQVLSQRPGVYMVPEDQVAEIRRLVEEFARLHQLASDPATRTQPVTAAKRQALLAARTAIQPLARFIRHNPNITDADRALLGIDPPVTERRRWPAPQSRPILVLSGVVAGGHEITACDAADPTGRWKPEGVKELELVVAFTPVGVRPIADILELLRQAQPVGSITRSRARTILPNDKVTMVANYLGRWKNSRGEAGPWSDPVRMIHALPADAELGRQAA